MSLSSASTDTQVQAQFDDNYGRTVTCDRTAIEACIIRLRIPAGGSFAGRAWTSCHS